MPEGGLNQMNPVHIFYYSRKKLGLYLCFNIILLTLAVLFTLTIFPEYPVVYYFAIGSCLLSVTGALIVFLLPLRLAVISPQDIKIDRGAPLPWKAVRRIHKLQIGRGLFTKTILRLETGRLGHYHMNLMQRLTRNSQFGAFSIPLYAMNAEAARDIEKIIRRYHAAVVPPARKAKSARGRKKAEK